MEQHPIKPGTPVLLPNRSAVAAPRRSGHSRRIRKPEERIIRLKKLIIMQSIAFLLVLTGFVLTVLFLSQQIEEKQNASLPGQNYSTVETTVEG